MKHGVRREKKLAYRYIFIFPPPFLQFKHEDPGIYVLFTICEWVHSILFFTKILTMKNGEAFFFILSSISLQIFKVSETSCSKTVPSTSVQLQSGYLPHQGLHQNH